MTDASNRIVQKLWSYCNVLRDDGLSYQDYLEQLTFLLLLELADERAALTGKEQSIPGAIARVVVESRPRHVYWCFPLSSWSRPWIHDVDARGVSSRAPSALGGRKATAIATAPSPIPDEPMNIHA